MQSDKVERLIKEVEAIFELHGTCNCPICVKLRAAIADLREREQSMKSIDAHAKQLEELKKRIETFDKFERLNWRWGNDVVKRIDALEAITAKSTRRRLVITDANNHGR